MVAFVRVAEPYASDLFQTGCHAAQTIERSYTYIFPSPRQLSDGRLRFISHQL